MAAPLTIIALRKNPWNVLTRPLPADADPLLLELAYLAAHYCRASESRLMLAARSGAYVPLGWLPEAGFPDVHEENEAYACDADSKLIEICHRYKTSFGIALPL